MTVLFRSDPTKPGSLWDDFQCVGSSTYAYDPVKSAALGFPVVQVRPMQGSVVDEGCRAEVAIPLHPDRSHMLTPAEPTTLWYATKAWFPVGWECQQYPDNDGNDCWSVLPMQLHAPDVLGTSPLWAIGVGARERGGPQLVTFADCYGWHGHNMEMFQSGPSDVLAFETPITLLVAARISPATDGFVQLWRADGNGPLTQRAHRNGVTAQYPGVRAWTGGAYLKTGHYMGPKSTTTAPCWIGPVVVADSQADALAGLVS